MVADKSCESEREAIDTGTTDYESFYPENDSYDQ